MQNRIKTAFLVGVAAALTVAAGSQLTGGGGLTRVVLSGSAGNLLKGSGTSTNGLWAGINVGSGCTGTGSDGSALSCSGGGSATVTTAAPIQGTGSAGSAVTLASADYGDVTVTGGTTWSVDALPESRITNLTSDLAAKANASSLATIATSGNASDLISGSVLAARMPALTGDVTSSAGSVATVISANAVTNAKLAQMVTLTVKANLTGSTANASDVTIAALAAAILDAAGYRCTDLGDGSDDNPVFDGTNTYSYTTKSGTCAPTPCTYTLTRQVFWISPTVNSGITIKPDGWPMRWSGDFVNNGDVNVNGNDAVGTTPGAASWNGGARQLPAGTIGGNPTSGISGGASGSAPQYLLNTGGTAGTAGAGNGALGTNGVAGVVGRGGGGGGGGNAAVAGNGSTGGTGGTVTNLNKITGDGREYYQAINGTSSGNVFTGPTGGGSGGAGGVSAVLGGAGGGGSGYMSGAGRSVSGSGTWRAKGGAGTPGTNSTGTGGGGGGGAGGSGGVIALYLCSGPYPSVDISGGLGAIGGLGGTGGGSGGSGAAGGSGYYVKITP